MKRPQLDALLKWHLANKCDELRGRRIILSDMLGVLSKFDDVIVKEVVGSSYQGRPIYKIRAGTGPVKVLMWTQMHGNESTGTKAFIDLLQFLTLPGEFAGLVRFILDRCTIVCLPLLNPDGAEAYTRLDSQGIDLNRDVLDKRAPESKLLQQVLLEEDPNYCFNLHDQRNIFSVGNQPKTATISFLAPSENQERSLTEGRKKTMRAIVAMHDFLEQGIPGHIGRYTDEFYPTATGDNFQKMGYSTILIESGHFPGDLHRESARKYTFAALVEGLRYMADGRDAADHERYFEIPDNEKRYLDLIVRNVFVNGEKSDLGILLKEEWDGETLRFVPTLDSCGDLSALRADRIEDGQGRAFDSKMNAEKWVENTFI